MSEQPYADYNAAFQRQPFLNFHVLLLETGASAKCNDLIVLYHKRLILKCPESRASLRIKFPTYSTADSWTQFYFGSIENGCTFQMPTCHSMQTIFLEREQGMSMMEEFAIIVSYYIAVD